jgi:hypothetical protein
VRKKVIYAAMGKDFFLDNMLKGMSLSYKMMGKTITNGVMNQTGGFVFTSGQTIKSLVKDMTAHN